MPRASAGAGAAIAAAPTVPTVARTANVLVIMILILLSNFVRSTSAAGDGCEGTGNPAAEIFLAFAGTKFERHTFYWRWRGKITSGPSASPRGYRRGFPFCG